MKNITLILFLLITNMLFSNNKDNEDYNLPITKEYLGDFDKEKILYIYNWIEYIDPEIISEFENLTGIKVVLDVFDSNETLEVKLLAGNSGYDLVFPSASPYFARQLQAGIYQKLDKRRLKCLKYIDNFFMKQISCCDSKNEYAIPYLWGISGFAVNINKIKKYFSNEEMSSWSLIFDEKNLKKIARYHVEMSDSASELFPAVLKYLGVYNYDKITEEELLLAFNLLKKIRKYIFKFNSSAVQDLFTNTACVAMGTSGDIRKILISARREGKKLDIKFIIPKEGAALWIDVCAIPKGARHVKNAHAFINFLMHPRIIARITNYTACANAVKKSKIFIRQEILDDKVVYPDQSIIDKCYREYSLSPELERMRTRMFTKIKSEVKE